MRERLTDLRPTAERGIVFNIQRFTTHDGPGIRTEVFLKGCPLSCRWCSNPEGMRPGIEIGVSKTRCIGVEKCGWCIHACPKGEAAFRTGFVKDVRVVTGLDRSLCDGCGACTEACVSSALHYWGRPMTVPEVMEEILADRIFYRNSGGGATFSGGDCSVQWPFLKNLLAACREQGIHTCVESTFHCDPSVIDTLFPYTDLFISDLKHLDSAVHRKYTGVGNERILSNLRRLTEMDAKLILRIPVVPGINDTHENLEQSAAFINQDLQGKLVQLQLLRFRKLGTEKYESLDRPYPMEDFPDPDNRAFEKHIREIASYFRDRGIPAIAGTNQKPKETV